jgi:hypothetical protein
MSKPVSSTLRRRFLKHTPACYSTALHEGVRKGAEIQIKGTMREKRDREGSVKIICEREGMGFIGERILSSSSFFSCCYSYLLDSARLLLCRDLELICLSFPL